MIEGLDLDDPLYASYSMNPSGIAHALRTVTVGVQHKIIDPSLIIGARCQPGENLVTVIEAHGKVLSHNALLTLKSHGTITGFCKEERRFSRHSSRIHKEALREFALPEPVWLDQRAIPVYNATIAILDQLADHFGFERFAHRETFALAWTVALTSGEPTLLLSHDERGYGDMFRSFVGVLYSEAMTQGKKQAKHAPHQLGLPNFGVAYAINNVGTSLRIQHSTHDSDMRASFPKGFGRQIRSAAIALRHYVTEVANRLQQLQISGRVYGPIPKKWRKTAEEGQVYVQISPQRYSFHDAIEARLGLERGELQDGNPVSKREVREELLVSAQVLRDTFCRTGHSLSDFDLHARGKRELLYNHKAAEKVAQHLGYRSDRYWNFHDALSAELGIQPSDLHDGTFVERKAVFDIFWTSLPHVVRAAARDLGVDTSTRMSHRLPYVVYLREPFERIAQEIGLPLLTEDDWRVQRSMLPAMYHNGSNGQ